VSAALRPAVPDTLRPAVPDAPRVDLLADCSDAIPVLGAWVCDAWPDAGGRDPTWAARQLRGWRRRRTLPLGLVGRDAQNAPVGLAALLPGTSPEGDEVVLLTALLVAPWARLRGTGRALCAAALAHAARLGVPTLHLYTSDAEAFYRRLGWRLIGDAIIGGAARPRAVAFMAADTAGGRQGGMRHD
jgi:predicted N-acetyltransferase YhbS